jgi:hypothetical protein
LGIEVRAGEVGYGHSNCCRYYDIIEENVFWVKDYDAWVDKKLTDHEE